MTTALAVLMILYAVFSGLAWLASWKLRRAAREWHAALNGESPDWLNLPVGAGVFVQEVIAMEKALVARRAEAKRRALVHLFHPLTPAMWFCGDRTAGGTGSLGDENLTCEKCRERFWMYEAVSNRPPRARS